MSHCVDEAFHEDDDTNHLVEEDALVHRKVSSETSGAQPSQTVTQHKY